MRCTAATLRLEKPRDADLFIYLCRASYTGDNGARREQWRERDTARYVRPSRISQLALRTYVRTPRDSWVELWMQRDVLSASWENGRFVSPENNVSCRARRFTLFTGRGYFIVLAKFTARGTRLVQNIIRFWFSHSRDSFLDFNIKSSFLLARPTN